MRPSTEALLRYPIFKRFSPAEIASVARVVSLVELSAGEVLFEKGAPGSSMFFLEVGRIQIDTPINAQQFKTLATLEPPTLFGEMSLLNNEPRSARALALRPTVLWEMSQASLTSLAEEKHAAAFKIMVWIASELSNRLRDTNEKLVDIYAKPFKSMQELKQQLAEMTPGFVKEGFEFDETIS